MEILLTKQSSFPIAESRSQFEDHHVNYLKRIVLRNEDQAENFACL